MMTREEILSIDEYCAEHKITAKQRLIELGLPTWKYYRSKTKYRKEDQRNADPGQFIQLSSGNYVSQLMPPSRTARKVVNSNKNAEIPRSFLTIEIQTQTGVAMRIQGEMSATSLIRELITAGDV